MGRRLPAPERRLLARRRAYAAGRMIAEFAICLRVSRGFAKVRVMNALQGRMVVVPADTLDDLLELTRLAAERLPDDQLAKSLRATASEVRVAAVMEP